MAAGEVEGRLVPRGRVRESVRTVRTDRALRGARQQHSQQQRNVTAAATGMWNKREAEAETDTDKREATAD